MAATPERLSISDAVEEILKRQRRAAAASQAEGGRPARVRPRPVQPDAGTGVRYGALYAPPLADLAGLRRQQAAFARTGRDLDRRNSWMAIPALAPFALPAADGIAALALRAVARGASPKHSFDLPELEAWQRNSRQPGTSLDRDAKTALREAGRDRIAQANRIRASQMGAEVHHSDPLEWALTCPLPDPAI